MTNFSLIVLQVSETLCRLSVPFEHLIVSPMHPRAAELIAKLDLRAHPEGGYFSESFRSTQNVRAGDLTRTASTAIYFLLTDGDISRWHSVTADEVWHHYEGDPLELWMMDPACTRASRLLLGPFSAARYPQHVVPSGHWQAARTLGAYTLVGCTVAPGFEFADFKMLSHDEAMAARVQQRHPELVTYIRAWDLVI